MSAEILVIQGTDCRILIRWKNPDGTPRDLSALTGYATCISDLKGNPLFKWSNNSLTCFGSITASDAAQGEFYFDFTADQNCSVAEGYYYFEIKVQIDAGGSPWRSASIRAKIIHVVPSSFNGLLS